MDAVNINTLMAHVMKVRSKEIFIMAKENSPGPTKNHTLVNGKKTSWKAMVNCIGQMVVNILDNSKTIWNMAKVT